MRCSPTSTHGAVSSALFGAGRRHFNALAPPRFQELRPGQGARLAGAGRKGNGRRVDPCLAGPAAEARAPTVRAVSIMFKTEDLSGSSFRPDASLVAPVMKPTKRMRSLKSVRVQAGMRRRSSRWRCSRCMKGRRPRGGCKRAPPNHRTLRRAGSRRHADGESKCCTCLRPTWAAAARRPLLSTAREPTRCSNLSLVFTVFSACRGTMFACTRARCRWRSSPT